MAKRRGRQNGDPMGSEKPRGKSREQRKSGRDGTSWTGTERTIRDGLMNQFRRTGEGPGGVSEAFRAGYDAIDWSK